MSPLTLIHRSIPKLTLSLTPTTSVLSWHREADTRPPPPSRLLQIELETLLTLSNLFFTREVLPKREGRRIRQV